MFRENQRVLNRQRQERIRQIREENQRRIREIMRENSERQRNFESRMQFPSGAFFPFYFNNNRQNIINNNMNNNLRDFFNQNDNIIYKNNNIGNKLEEIDITQDIINKAESKECSICLEEYIIKNKISYLPCFHFFHSTCIKKWLKTSKKCPLCNIDIQFE